MSGRNILENTTFSAVATVVLSVLASILANLLFFGPQETRRSNALQLIEASYSGHIGESRKKIFFYLGSSEGREFLNDVSASNDWHQEMWKFMDSNDELLIAVLEIYQFHKAISTCVRSNQCDETMVFSHFADDALQYHRLFGGAMKLYEDLVRSPTANFVADVAGCGDLYKQYTKTSDCP